MYLKPCAAPAPGTGLLSIPSPDHDNGPLPEKGGWVEASSYWRRRLLAGDVVDDTEAETQREAEASKPAKPAKTAIPVQEA